MTKTLNRNLQDPIDEEEWGDYPTRLCIECGTPLPEDWFYLLCEDCSLTKACYHGVPYLEACSKCCSESDFNFDAMRERGRR